MLPMRSSMRFKFSHILREGQTRRRILRTVFAFSLLIFIVVDFNIVHIPSDTDIIQAHNKYRQSHFSSIPNADDPPDHILDKYDAEDDSVLPVENDRMVMTADAGDTEETHPLDIALRSPTNEDTVEVTKIFLDALVEIVSQWRITSIAVCPCDGRQSLISKLITRLEPAGFLPSFICVASSEEQLNSIRANFPSNVPGDMIQNELFSKNESFPHADMYLVWPGLDNISASQALTFYNKVRESGSDIIAVGVFRHISESDDGFEEWREDVKTRNIDVRRVHDLTKPPFMFGHPKTRFIGVSRDNYRELFIYDAANLRNEFA